MLIDLGSIPAIIDGFSFVKTSTPFVIGAKPTMSLLTVSLLTVGNAWGKNASEKQTVLPVNPATTPLGKLTNPFI